MLPKNRKGLKDNSLKKGGIKVSGNNTASRLLLGFCIILLVAIFANPVFSQEPQIRIFTEIQVKPGMGYEFNKFLKEEAIPAMKKGGQQELGAWKPAVFGIDGKIVFSASMNNFAEFDSPHPIVKAMGPYGAQAMFAKMERFATSIRTFAMRGLPDLEIPPPEGYVTKLGFQVKATITPGRDKEYEENAKVVKEVLKKTNAKGFYAGRVGIGGNPNQYYFLVLFDSFADMDAFGIAFEKAISETKMPEMTGIVQHVEYSMWASDPELSIQPAAQ